MNNQKTNFKFTAFYLIACLGIVLYACTRNMNNISPDSLSSKKSLSMSGTLGTSVWKFTVDDKDCISVSDQYYYAAPYSCPLNASQRGVDSSMMAAQDWAAHVWGPKPAPTAPVTKPCPSCTPAYFDVEYYGTLISTGMDNIIGGISGSASITLTIYVLQNGTTQGEGATYVRLSDVNGNSRCFGLFPTSGRVYNNNTGIAGEFYSTGGQRYDVSMTVNVVSVGKVSALITYLAHGLPSAAPYRWSWSYSGTTYAMGALNSIGVSINPPLSSPDNPYVFGNYLKTLTPPSSNVTISVTPGVAPADAGDFSGIQ